jgi:hypothetical protein
MTAVQTLEVGVTLLQCRILNLDVVNRFSKNTRVFLRKLFCIMQKFKAVSSRNLCSGPLSTGHKKLCMQIDHKHIFKLRIKRSCYVKNYKYDDGKKS